MQRYILFFTSLAWLALINVSAQNRVGIGTNAPDFSLDVRGQTHAFGQFKAGNGYAGIILDKSAVANNAYVLCRTVGVDKWTAGTFGNDNYTLTNWSLGANALTINISNNLVGVGVTDPAFRLDVNGRIRLRASNETAGIWLNNNTNTGATAFIGLMNDNHVGFWGNTGIGWSVVMNTDNGYLGVKNGDPKTELHILHGISNGANYGLRVQNSGSSNQEWTQYVVNTSGNLELYHNGSFRGSFDQASGAYTASSDARVKKNIQPPGFLLDNILKLDVKKYQFTKSLNDHEYYGLIAQQVEQVFPQLVFHNQGDDGKEYYTMDYGAVGVIALKGVQELKPAFDKQQMQIDFLMQQNKMLQEELAALKKEIKNITSLQSPTK